MKNRDADLSLAERDKRYKAVARETGDKYRAVRAYCAGNRWLEENAKAVGNWGANNE